MCQFGRPSPGRYELRPYSPFGGPCRIRSLSSSKASRASIHHVAPASRYDWTSVAPLCWSADVSPYTATSNRLAFSRYVFTYATISRTSVGVKGSPVTLVDSHKINAIPVCCSTEWFAVRPSTGKPYWYPGRL